jgi:hypothetical protein
LAAKNRNPLEPEIDDAALESDPRWRQASRLAASPVLARATQLRDILLYIVRQTVLDPETPLRESEIAHRVLGRRADFNPLDDNIVRVQMAHLRKRLEQYYAAEGKDEEVIISVALGSYRPIFTERTAELASILNQAAPTVAAQSPAIAIPEASSSAPQPATDLPAPLPASARHFFTLRTLVAIFGIALLSSCIFLYINDLRQKQKIHDLEQSLAPWRGKPTVAMLWAGFFDSEHDTDIVMGDDSLLLIEQLSSRYTTFTGYLNHTYKDGTQVPGLSPEMRSTIKLIASKGLGSNSEFKLAQKLLILDPQNKKVHIYGARQYVPASLKQNNVILIGGRISNPWEGLYDDRLNFTQATKFVDTGNTSVVNRSPLPGEKPGYVTSDEVGYCVIAFLPDPNQHTNVLLLEGTGSEATEAAGDFLSSEEQLSALLKKLHATRFPPFEVLLKISQVRGTPLTATIEAIRVDPQPR